MSISKAFVIWHYEILLLRIKIQPVTWGNLYIQMYHLALRRVQVLLNEIALI